MNCEKKIVVQPKLFVFCYFRSSENVKYSCNEISLIIKIYLSYVQLRPENRSSSSNQQKNVTKQDFANVYPCENRRKKCLYSTVFYTLSITNKTYRMRMCKS